MTLQNYIYNIGFLLLFMVVTTIADGQNSNSNQVTITIVSGETGVEIPFATLFDHNAGRGVIADAKGQVTFQTNCPYNYQISAIGYQSKTVSIQRLLSNSKNSISLLPQLFSIDEVNVIGVETKELSQGTKIERMAIDHIQASSFADLLELLPGNSHSDPELAEANFIALRQAGTDYNTSLGTAFVIDGVQRSNDASMGSMYGISYDSDKTSKGTDMRNIETDRIESVEVIDGVASAEYGDITSGLVIVNRKKGVEPLSFRIKTDPNSKLGAVRYGALLGKKAGAINMGASYTYFTSDPRTSLSEYNRINLSGNYINTWNSHDFNYTIDAAFDYTQSIDSYKDDPEIMYGSDDYIKSNYRSMYFSHHGALVWDKGILKKVDYTFGAGLTSDNMKRQELVSPGISGIPLNNEEGSKEGIYLPNEYDSFLEIDNRPVSLNGKLKVDLTPTLFHIRNKVVLGLEYKYDKNRGEGELYDATLPPVVPSSGYNLSTRPRPYNEVPAFQKLSLFVQDNFTIPLGSASWQNEIGVRATTLPGLNQQYAMHKKWYVQPRWNSNIQFSPFFLGNKKSQFNLHLGAGVSVKFPTLYQLFPQEIYYDYKQLDYYSQDPELRSVYIDTRIEDPTNYGLTPYKNRKIEIGPRLRIGQSNISITGFYEEMNNGYMNQTQVMQHAYIDYDESSVDPTTIDSKPTLDDFTSEVDSVNATFSQVKNGKQVIKKGIQYAVDLGKIDAINTSIHINGAYYHTYYSDTLVDYYKPNRFVNNEKYEIVGVYDEKSGETRQQFNTNIRLNTHIPSIGLLFSTSFQMMWFTKTTQDVVSGTPTSYILPNGEEKPFLEGDENDAMLQYLVTNYNEHSFETTTVPFALNVNLRATKEIGKALRFSFFVNRILNYLPDYTSKYGTTMVRSTTPSFGAEVQWRF